MSKQGYIPKNLDFDSEGRKKLMSGIEKISKAVKSTLGPRGKIPVPVPPNADISVFINRYKSAVLIRNKDQPQIMAPIGTEDMSPDDLVENAEAILSTLETKLPNGAHNIAKVIVKTTMGPPVPVIG